MQIRKITFILLTMSMLIFPVLTYAQDTDDNLKTLYIANEVVDCRGEDEPPCLLVRENPDENYAIWTDPIDGFNYIAGFDYEITVQTNELEDGTTQYTFEEIVALQATEETLATEFENEIIFYVSAEAVACPDDNETTCLLVRENPENNFRLLEEPIVGFTYNIGQEYELRVLVVPGETEEIPPTYLLLQILSPDMTTVDPDTSETPAETVDLTDIDTTDLLDEAQTIQIGELQIEISIPQGFLSSDLQDAGAPIYAFAPNSTVMENYFMQPNDVSELVIISINFTTEKLQENEVDTSSLGAIIFDLLLTDTQLGDPQDLIIEGGEGVTYPFTNTATGKSGAFSLLKFGDNYLLIQGSTSTENWDDNMDVYQAVLASIREVE